MHTVIALSERAKSSYRNWSVLFDPYIEQGVLSVCDWNQHSFARTLSQAIPGLQDVIKGKGEWRVIVIDTGDQGSGSPFENPFDFASNGGIELDAQSRAQFEDSGHAMIRLAHMLLGFPDLGVKSFSPDVSYVDRASGQRIYESSIIETAEAHGVSLDEAKLDFHARLATQRDVQVHYREETFSTEEIEQHKNVSANYRVRHAPPSDVTLIATRDPITANPTARLRKAWGEGEESGSSRFVERNNYPASCRFGVYDLHYREHTEYELDQMRFWLSVVTIATNILPPSSFQAERVYKLGVEINNEILGQVLNAHLAELAAVRDYLDSQVQAPQRPMDHPLEEILKERVVPVTFENLGGEGLSASTAGYGLAAHGSISDSSRWENSYRELSQSAEFFIRQPRRVLSRIVSDTRIHAQTFLNQDIELTEIEIEELREELTKRTNRLTQPATVNILNREKLLDLLRENHKKIRQAVATRLPLRSILLIALMVMIPWVMVFSPYLIGSFNKSGEHLIDSGLVAAGVIITFALMTLAALYVLKRRFLKLILSLNEQLRSFYLDVQNGASAFSKYLTDLATYMFGRSVLISSGEKKTSHQKTIEWLFATRKKVIERIDSEKTILRSVDHSIEITKIQYDRSRVDNFGFAEYRRIFRLPIGRGTANLNHTGEKINAPYAFIERLRLENLGVREVHKTSRMPSGGIQ